MAPPAEDRLATLKQQIADLEHQIHVLEYPPGETTQWPMLLNNLESLERELGGPTADSPTLRKGSPPRPAFAFHPHEAPWEDPQSVQSVAELKTFHQRVSDSGESTFVATATMSGVDVALTYEAGVLRKAVLRGDGVQGEDVLDNIRTLHTVPLRLKQPGTTTESRVTKINGQGYGPSTMTPVPPFPERFEVRIAVVLNSLDQSALDRRRVDSGDPPYISARGAVMSSLRKLDARVTASRRLRAFALGCPSAPPGIETQWGLLGALKSWGFAIQPITWRCRGLQEVLDFVTALQQQAPTFDYPLEGGLLVANRMPQGHASKHARLVFPLPGRPAVVSRTYHAVGRGGAILPVAMVGKAPEHDLPVPERAPIPAADGQTVLDVNAGVRIRVRPGAVAPVIMMDDADGVPRAAIENCPACRRRLEAPADDPFLRCINVHCSGRARARLLHLVGPRGLRLQTLNVKMVDRLLSELGSLELADFFALDADSVERFAPGQGAKVVQDLAALKRMPLWRFLYLSAIPHVCENQARTLVRHIRSVERLEALIPAGVTEAPGLLPEAIESFNEWLRTSGRDALARAREVGMSLLGDEEVFSAPFLGKRVVVAGEIEQGANLLADEIERRGGIIQARVGRMTDLVIVGQAAQDVFDAAVMYDVPIVEEKAVADVLRSTSARSPVSAVASKS